MSRSGGAALVSAPLTALAADGWQATYAGTPPSTVIESWFDNISRQGYTTSGATTTYNDRIHVTRRVRQAYPNQASFTTDTVAISEKLYSTDTIAGVTNNSTAVSPKPIANWALYDRTVVANSITVEVVAAHYNGRNNSQVACVVFRATDGTTTVETTVSATTVSGRSSDQNAVLVYSGTLDITSLNSGVITVNAKVYPWIGAAASVLDSADQSNRREFSPRYYLKDATRANNPPYAYVTSAGNDGTGVWSTTAATAEASPFLTVQGAILAAAAQMPAGDYLTGTGTSRPIDGGIIRVGSGTVVLGATGSSRPQVLGAVVVTRDPNVARADSILSFGTTAWRPRLGVGTLDAAVTEGAIVFRDISLTRTGTSTLNGEAGTQLDIIFDDVSLDGNSNSGTLFSNSHGRAYGLVVTDCASTTILSPGTLEWRCLRGVSGDADASIEGWLILGSWLERVQVLSRGTRTQSGSIIAFNTFPKLQHTAATLAQGATEDVTGLVIVQNLFEYVGTSNVSTLRISGDGNAGDITHLIHVHNTYTGFDDIGRWNMLYNETAADPRTHTFIRSAGNITPSVNTKHDVFFTDGTRTQSWEYVYGVGCIGEFAMYANAGSGGQGFSQEYPGLLSFIGTSDSVPEDPLFTDYQGTTSGPTAGAGNGDYTLQSGSPAAERVSVGLLSHDLAGVARPTPILGNTATYDASGAYTL
jgi:hypothetical protein